MKLKAGAVMLLCLLTIAGSLFYISGKRQLWLQPPKSPLNVLVLSVCSLRRDHFARYADGQPGSVPALDRFVASSSIVFDNAINGLGWTAIYFYVGELMPDQMLMNQGFRLLGLFSPVRGWLRVPWRRSDLRSQGEMVNDNDFEKDHQATTDFLRSRLLGIGRPFFTVVHYKYLHYPLIDRFNADSGWDRYLTGDERRRLAEDLNHPEAHPEKLPFLLMLSNDSKYAFAHPRVRASGLRPDAMGKRAVTGLVNNPEFLRDWKNSPGFEEDLKLLKKVYRGNVRYLDQVLEPLLDLYGNDDLKRNTVVVLTPDHGELHMERDHLTHATSLYDEGLRVPLAVRFPGQKGAPVTVAEQTDLWALAKVLHQVVEGQVRTVEKFRQSMLAEGGEAVVLRDCAHSVRGLRYQNRYKYLVDVADGRRRLYDLSTDPGETLDLARERPEIADQMEEIYWQRFPEYSKVDPYPCAPWGP